MRKMTSRNLRWASVVLSLAIAGCAAAPTWLHPATPARSDLETGTQSVGATGSLAIAVNWPERPAGYQAQVIPDRAASMSLAIANAAGEILVSRQIARTGSEGYPFGNPYGTYVWDDTLHTYVYAQTAATMRWTFPEQEGLKIRAVLFDAANREVGAIERTTDIIAGMTNEVVLDVVPQDAPTLTSLDTTQLQVGMPVRLTGSGFKKFSNVDVFFQTEGYSYGQATDSFEPVGSKYYLATTQFKVVSDTRIDATISAQVTSSRNSPYASWDLTDALSSYFQIGNAQRLYLGVAVDGVSTHRIEVTLPRTAPVTAQVSVTRGTDPAALTDKLSDELDLTLPPFNVPTASGTVWQYVQPGTDDYHYDIQTDGQGGYYVRAYYSPTGYVNAGGASITDSPFFHPRAMGAIQILPDVQVSWQGRPYTAKHLFWTESSAWNWGSSIEAYLLPGIGVVRIIGTQVLVSNNTGSVASLVSQAGELYLESYQAAPVPSPSPSASATVQ